MKELVVERIDLTNASIFRREVYLVSLVVPRDSGEIVTPTIKTDPVRGVKNDEPLIFDPPVTLCRFKSSSVACGSLTVMESDADFRRVGALVGSNREKVRNSRLGQRLSQAGALGSVGSALAMIRPVLSGIVELLRRNGDDVLAELNVDTGEVLLDGDGRFAFSDGNATVHLRLVETEEKAAATDAAQPEPEAVTEEPASNPLDDLPSEEAPKPRKRRARKPRK